ncbi:hypothetical protein GGE50_007102 [Rhizobium leguminosarum]|nr:hypothetical protein [Rhizobium leguminosarum]MBB4346026.1 hypothetical protein [Rhizobium leguminosarum]MBB4358666.1 hypothetical protein [Rhizobium leguminosarum]MBB4390698.1 hypothetical protein [Rhizobium leguminosarum]MBB4470101.1 hypothetical protein [Rhizobium leguminosarum]
MSMSLTGQIDRPPGCQGFPPLDTPATSRRIGSRPLQGRGSLLSLSGILFYSSKSGVKDGPGSRIFPQLRFSEKSVLPLASRVRGP